MRGDTKTMTTLRPKATPQHATRTARGTFAAGNTAGAKDRGPRTMWAGRLPLATQQIARDLVARGLADSQADAIADALDRHAVALGLTLQR